MQSKSLVFERSYQASIEKVWQAITDKEQLRQWYFEVSDFKPEVGFRFHFYGENANGKKLLHHCVVTEVAPPSKLSYTWGYEGHTGQSLLTFELREETKKTTRLKLTHSGTETFPHDHKDFDKADFNKGWNEFLDGPLRQFVDETAFISKSIIIKAPSATIWEVLLNPNGQWGKAFGGGAIAETDWKKGSTIIWKDTDGNVGANGRITIRDEQHELRFQYYDDIVPAAGAEPGRYAEQFSIVPENGSTTLQINVGPLVQKDLALHTDMWNNALTMIKDLSER